MPQPEGDAKGDPGAEFDLDGEDVPEDPDRVGERGSVRPTVPDPMPPKLLLLGSLPSGIPCENGLPCSAQKATLQYLSLNCKCRAPLPLLPP